MGASKVTKAVTNEVKNQTYNTLFLDFTGYLRDNHPSRSRSRKSSRTPSPQKSPRKKSSLGGKETYVSFELTIRC